MVIEEGLVKWFSRYELCFSFDFYALHDLVNHTFYYVLFHAELNLLKCYSTEEFKRPSILNVALFESFLCRNGFI